MQDTPNGRDYPLSVMREGGTTTSNTIGLPTQAITGGFNTVSQQLLGSKHGGTGLLDTFGQNVGQFNGSPLQQSYDTSKFNFSSSLDPLVENQIARTQRDRGETLQNRLGEFNNLNLDPAARAAMAGAARARATLAGNGDRIAGIGAQRDLDMAKETATQNRYQVANAARQAIAGSARDDYATRVSGLQAGLQPYLQMYGGTGQLLGNLDKRQSVDMGRGIASGEYGDQLYVPDWRAPAGSNANLPTAASAQPTSGTNEWYGIGQNSNGGITFKPRW